MQFDSQKVESKWKKKWKELGTYKVSNDSPKPKFYVLDMFPYPSGAGLHVGHPLGYIASDIYARFKTMKGFNVLHPMGFDAFGLPAEQYAIQTGVHPAKSTADNIAMYKSQLENIGFNYDWSREVVTCDPSYYKWTQWIFLKLYEHYYDITSNTAKPISNLITHFEQYGNMDLNVANSYDSEFSAEEWNTKSSQEREEILMNYRLAYRKDGFVNWCEALGTVLANDEVKDGLSERGGHPVERRAMKQWSLRITAYAERLLNGLDTLEWSDALVAMQRNWIGRSEGAQLFFSVVGNGDKIEIFTTRPDTIFGASFMVLAPEHELVKDIVTLDQKQEIDAYLDYVSSRSERERMSETKVVTGAFTGAYATNPFTETKIPIYISEYVLKDYGTGAIMAVPSDDERDHAFATKFNLPIIPVVDKSDYPNAGMQDKVGIMINSGFLNGMKVKEAIKLMYAEIENRGLGKKVVNYKLRDANFSRQRYWGEPIPIKYDKNGTPHEDDKDSLPLELPELNDFQPSSGGKSPLARVTDWVNTKDGMERETDTMPGFAGSSWYFLRYMDAHNDKAFASEQALNYWRDVDLYIGGTEHAVGHLMYSRFWHKFLYDLNLVPTDEPFKKLINQGMIQGVIEYIYLSKEKQNGKSRFVSSDLVTDDEDYAKIPVHVDFVSDYGSPKSHLNSEGIQSFLDWRPEYKGAIFVSKSDEFDSAAGIPNGMNFYTVSEVGKMSKRYFNVVNPDDVIAQYGADCFRMYEMFLGPIEQSKPWDTKGIDGVSKFLKKFYNLYLENDALIATNDQPTGDEMKALHTAIKKVNEGIEQFSFNTCVSSFMICVNELKKSSCHSREVLEPLCKLMAPFAPFMTEEIWEQLGHSTSVHHEDFPQYNEKYLKESTILYPICINGKKRDEINLDADLKPADIEAHVKGMDLSKWMDGKTPKKFIIVPGRMINIVI